MFFQNNVYKYGDNFKMKESAFIKFVFFIFVF